MKQVKFKDTENDVIHGGILLDNGDVVCGCCGGLITKDEIDNPDEFNNITILETFDTWTDLDKTILEGDRQ